MPEESAEEILAQPSERRRAIRSNREYAGISPHTSEKMAIERARFEDKSRQHLKDCANVGT